MKRILAVSALLLGATVLGACTDKTKQITYDGQYFRAKASKVDKQRDVFVVNVRDVSRSPKGARQAAYHIGVSFCLDSFGSSDILWVQDPLDDEIPLQVVDDTISIQGRCPQAQEI